MRRTLALSIAAFILSSLLCFVILEVTVRAVWKTEPQYGYPSGLTLPNATRGYEYARNFSGYFLGGSYKNISIQTNSVGLRDSEHTYAKPPGTIRILGLGDSVTFGAGVAYEDTYLRVLEKNLQQEGYPVEIIKAGHGGYNFNQEYTYYIEEGYRYDPDIVLIGIVLDDVVVRDPALVEKNEVTLTWRGKIANFIGEHFKSVKFVWWLYRDLVYTRSKNYNDVYYASVVERWSSPDYVYYNKTLAALQQNLSREHRTLVLAIFPLSQQLSCSYNRTDIPQQKIKTLAKEHGIRVLDLRPVFDTPDCLALFLYQDHAHPTAQGDALAAGAIEDYLLDQRLLRSSR